MTATLVLFSVIALLWLVLWLSPAHRANFCDLLDASTSLPAVPGDLPPVVVIIAARNEATMLPQTIPTICGQDYPDLQVIVVDDQSEDDSQRVVSELQSKHPNLSAIRGGDRPAGWMGKCWAVQQGVAHARSAATGDSAALLLFTDADIVFHPLVVRQAVARLQADKLDMLSLMPRCVCESPIERLGVGGLMTLLGLMFPIGWANDPQKKWSALACGGFILIRPRAYADIGGHACVRASMIEDVNLAQKLKRSGAYIAMHHTRDLLSTRMYESAADLWEGLTKNAYAGMEYQPRKFWVGLVTNLVVSVLPPAYLLIAILWALKMPGSRAFAACGLAVLINLLMTMIHARTIRHLRIPFPYAFTLPVSSALYNLIAMESARQHHYQGGNSWKGRRYDRSMLLNPSNDSDDLSPVRNP